MHLLRASRVASSIPSRTPLVNSPLFTSFRCALSNSSNFFGGPSVDSANFQKWRDNGNCLRALVPFRAKFQVLIELGEEGLVAVHLKQQRTNAERVEVENFELRFYEGNNYSVRCCEPLVFNAAVVPGII